MLQSGDCPYNFFGRAKKEWRITCCPNSSPIPLTWVSESAARRKLWQDLRILLIPNGVDSLPKNRICGSWHKRKWRERFGHFLAGLIPANIPNLSRRRKVYHNHPMGAMWYRKRKGSELLKRIQRAVTRFDRRRAALTYALGVLPPFSLDSPQIIPHPNRRRQPPHFAKCGGMERCVKGLSPSGLKQASRACPPPS